MKFSQFDDLFIVQEIGAAIGHRTELSYTFSLSPFIINIIRKNAIVL